MLLLAASLISLCLACVLMIIMVIDILAVFRLRTRHSWPQLVIDMSFIMGLSCMMMVSGQMLISQLIPA